MTASLANLAVVTAFVFISVVPTAPALIFAAVTASSASLPVVTCKLPICCVSIDKST